MTRFEIELDRKPCSPGYRVIVSRREGDSRCGGRRRAAHYDTAGYSAAELATAIGALVLLIGSDDVKPGHSAELCDVGFITDTARPLPQI